MKVLIYSPSSEFDTLDLVVNGVRKKVPDFSWIKTDDASYFTEALGFFKINASSFDIEGNVDLRWPAPSIFLRDNKKKEKVWEDIHSIVIPALEKNTVTKQAILLTDGQLQQLLSSISGSNFSFELDHPDGFVIGVNKPHGVDVSLTGADISSMLAASWLFGSKGVRLALA